MIGTYIYAGRAILQDGDYQVLTYMSIRFRETGTSAVQSDSKPSWKGHAQYGKNVRGQQEPV